MDGNRPSGSSGYPLLRRESTKRSFSTMPEGQRSHSPDSLFVAQDDHYGNEDPSQRPRMASGLALPPRPFRFPGDGLDFRRPMMSGIESGGGGGSSSSTHARRPGAGSGIIDLTNEQDSHENGGHLTSAPSHIGGRAQRGPRFGRNIIDLESEGEDEARARSNSHAPALLPSRPNYLTLFPPRPPSITNPHPRFSNLRRPERAAPPRRADMEEHGFRRTPYEDFPAESTRGHRSVTPYPNGAAEPIDLTGEDDDVVLVSVRAGVNAARPETTAGTGTRSVQDRFNDLREMAGGGRLFSRLWGPGVGVVADAPNAQGAQAPNDGPRGQIRFAAILPVNLGYELPGFDYGLGGNQPEEPPYEPPPAASKGFTRSPGEEDVVVCPNCGDELAVSDDEKKAEVWIIKKCGHAYCGNCAALRTKAARGKGKAPAHSMPLPFKECVVAGCQEKAGPKAMLHVYVGS